MIAPPSGVPFDPLTAFAALTTQVGGRHIVFNFTDAQKRFFAHPLTQQVILFGMFYFSTRRLLIAFAILVVYNLAIQIFLNENHPLNLFSRSWLVKEGFKNRDESSVDMYLANIAKL
jgi:hypothetical protein